MQNLCVAWSEVCSLVVCVCVHFTFFFNKKFYISFFDKKRNYLHDMIQHTCQTTSPQNITRVVFDKHSCHFKGIKASHTCKHTSNITRISIFGSSIVIVFMFYFIHGENVRFCYRKYLRKVLRMVLTINIKKYCSFQWFWFYSLMIFTLLYLPDITLIRHSFHEVIKGPFTEIY